MKATFSETERAELVRTAQAALGSAPDGVQNTPFWEEFGAELDRLEAAELAPIEKRDLRP